MESVSQNQLVITEADLTSPERARITGPHWDRVVAAAVFGLDLTELLLRSSEREVPASRIILAAIVLGLAALSLAARRLRPKWVLLAAVVAQAAASWAAGPPVGLVSTVVIVALYSAGRYLPLRNGWATGLIAIPALALTTAASTDALGAAGRFTQQADFWALTVEGLANVLFLLTGQLVRMRAAQIADARRAAVQTERRRIARELHDVVAHHVSLMKLLVGAARTNLPHAQERASEALVSAEAVAGAAVAEMRQLLTVLRADDPPQSGLHAAKGAAGLSDLVRQANEAGTPTSIEITGEASVLPAAIDLAVYRVGQESLTNVRKHGGDGARCRVSLRYRPGAVNIEISDDGRGPRAGRAGLGLVGLSERVALCGGRLEAGARPEGGFRVRAWMPLPPPADGERGQA
jgi:signal transduction histidine kinase